MLKIHNTLLRDKQVFAPIEPGLVRMYVCGMTVYDYCHLGHARVLVVFDMVARWLRASGYRVVYVRNITDIDDKIIRRAQENGESIQALTDRYIAYMHEDAGALGVLKPDHEPRATQHVAAMQRLIGALERNGYAYVAANRDVCYSVRKFEGYGRLSGKSLEDLRAGERVDVMEGKHDPLDFVLWKHAKEGEPDEAKWESPWGSGRPGWHIECSVMSAAHLGETFDIHGGGIDLVFPHHENEIAQSRCTHGTPVMANYWLHNGFLQVEGKKMAKSEGNFVTIHDLLHTDKFGGRKWPGEVLRLAMLMTHYREPIDFSVRRLEEAEATIHRWAKIRKAYSDRNWVKLNSAETTPSLADPIADFLADDLNTVSAIQTMQTMARVTEAALRDGDEGNMYVGLRLLASIAWLGIDLGPETAALSGPEIEEVLIEREVNRRLALIRERNFAEADRIREDLAAQGIQLMDYKDPETGERRTKWEVKR